MNPDDKLGAVLVAGGDIPILTNSLISTIALWNHPYQQLNINTNIMEVESSKVFPEEDSAGRDMHAKDHKKSHQCYMVCVS